MKYHSAFVEITGKVFVSVPDLLERLELSHPTAVRDKDSDDQMDAYTEDDKREAFQELANEKIRALFPTDEPMKMNEAIIDMATYS